LTETDLLKVAKHSANGSYATTAVGLSLTGFLSLGLISERHTFGIDQQVKQLDTSVRYHIIYQSSIQNRNADAVCRNAFCGVDFGEPFNQCPKITLVCGS